MESFVLWLDRPFQARRGAERTRRRTRGVIIRYRGSFTRSAVKVLLFLALLTAMSNAIGERKVPIPHAPPVASTAGAANPRY